ncbi:hypothetical protein Hanom_Chr05g00453461 [Helianthus anomalus]
MASKTSESSSSAPTSSDALYVKWGLTSFNNLIQDYVIRAEWNLVLPSKTDTTFLLKKGKITLFSYFFKFCNFRLPITKFCKLVLDHYPIHISQLHSLGLVKLRQFEFACIALGHIPELTVFRAFFVLVWKPPFFTFDRRDTDVYCLRDIPASSKDKDWKKKFFYINAGVIPGEMQWREMGPKDKVKDDGPPKDAYVANALFKRLCECPSECTVIPEGALVMAGMSLLWRKWSLLNFVDPPRNATLRAANRVIGEQEPDVLEIHLEQFLPPAVPVDPTAYISQPPPSGESSVSAVEEKKPIRVRVTGRKYMDARAATSVVTVGVFVPAGSVVVTAAATELVSPTRVSKKRKIVPALTAYEAIQTAYAMPTGCVLCPLVVCGFYAFRYKRTKPFRDYIRASAVAVVSCSMPPPMPTTVVVVTTIPVSTPLPSSVTPTSLFDSPFSIFSASENEMPTVSAAHESPRDTAMSDAGGSSSGIADDGARLGDDLYLPTINWDPNMQDKRYQPKWKIAESSSDSTLG